MYDEYVGSVKLNYNFYKGSDIYSDGSIEEKMLEIAKDFSDYEEILKDNNDWPILYHFSPIRENILNWFPFEKDCSALEVGAGCGAVTGALLKKGLDVTCIDLSKRRSLINAYRHKNYDNLEIIVGNYTDINITMKYDYITLIGVLEYAKMYINVENNPFIHFLKNVKNYLKEGGKLFIAIENKFGLKYWAGSKEDHTGVIFDSVEGYTSMSDVATFSKKELDFIVHEAGFNELEFYYPYPDYKLPLQIYSQKRMPHIGDLSLERFNYDYERLYLFDEKNAYDSIIESGAYDFFANSFLVVAS